MAVGGDIRCRGMACCLEEVELVIFSCKVVFKKGKKCTTIYHWIVMPGCSEESNCIYIVYIWIKTFLIKLIFKNDVRNRMKSVQRAE